jgi:hypothetical protein
MGFPSDAPSYQNRCSRQGLVADTLRVHGSGVGECEIAVLPLVERPAGTPHGFPFLAFDPCGRIHVPLTLFASEASRRLSTSTARAYASVLQPFFLDLLRDGKVWDAAPDVVRRQIADHLRGRLKCKVRPHRLGIEVVNLTDRSATGVRIFLSAAKLFY